MRQSTALKVVAAVYSDQRVDFALGFRLQPGSRTWFVNWKSELTASR